MNKTSMLAWAVFLCAASVSGTTNLEKMTIDSSARLTPDGNWTVASGGTVDLFKHHFFFQGATFTNSAFGDRLEPPLANSVDRASTAERLAKREETRVREVYGKLSLSFEMNSGQTDDRVRFQAHGAGYSLFLTDGEAVLSLRKGRSTKAANNSSAPPNILRMTLAGANKTPEISAEDEQEGRSNYFIGNDPAKWRTKVGHYGKVRYKNVYAGVDQVYYGNQGQLEYDFVVAPEADYEQISLRFAGAKEVRIDEVTGELFLQFHDGSEVRQQPPYAYQEVDGQRSTVAARYVKRQEGEIGFVIDGYDRMRPLVIDPVLVYSTYLGGSGSDGASGIAVDSSGNAYVIGVAGSTNFPTASPFQPANAGGSLDDAFVTKINAAGSALVYSTYLGGSGMEAGFSIAVDSSGNAYITGRTNSTNFPTANPIQSTNRGQDAFVTKINAAGSALVYSTYLGGDSDDTGIGIALDSSGNAYVTGLTSVSTNFPTANPIQAASGGIDDAFVTKINAAGSALVYSTYLGGSGNDYGRGIAVDPSGNAYVTGRTNSTNFPTASPIQSAFGGGFLGDAFVTKINAAGSALVYSTYLGGSDDENGFGIAVDASGNAYVTGSTASTDFPTANPIQAVKASMFHDAYVAKINAAGSALVYSTYLGGNGNEMGQGIAVDSSRNAYVTGWTGSTNFPTVNPIQPTLDADFDGTDAFVTKVNAAGSALVYSTYLGGTAGQDLGYAIAVDSSGSAYVTGYTPATNFPTASPIQPANGGGDFDAFVAKIGDNSAPPAPAQLLNIATRLRVQTGESVLIGGLIITGNDPKKVIIRGIGPSLAQFFEGALSDPVLELFQGSTSLESNDNWMDSADKAEIEATGIAPSNDLESAIVRTLAPGAYTAIVRGQSDSSGIGLVEVYDLDQAANSQLGNIATRGFVDTDNNVMIGGLIVGPEGGLDARVVVRAIGPSLSNFGINGALQDPTLELRNGDGALIRANDNWKESQQTELEETGLQPGDERESALVQTVAPGNYTAIVRGSGNTTGVGLVEVYNLK